MTGAPAFIGAIFLIVFIICALASLAWLRFRTNQLLNESSCNRAYGDCPSVPDDLKVFHNGGNTL